jgi:ribosomal protein S7
MLRRNRKERFALLPDLLANYRRLYVDVFSKAASLSRPEELFASAAKAGANAVFVIDTRHEPHMPLARRYFDLCRRYGLDCRHSEHKPAEVYAAELCEAECGAGSAVVTRDYDAVKAAERCAVLIFQKGKFWRAEMRRSFEERQ